MGEHDDLDRIFTSYVESLLLCMEQCADDARHRPDAALWNARRSTESLVGAVLVRLRKHDAWREKNSNLGALVGQVTAKFRETEGFLPRLQDLGNDGAHLRVWMRADPPWDEARFAAEKLAAAGGWFVAVSRRLEWGLPEPLALELERATGALAAAREGPAPPLVVLSGELVRNLAAVQTELRRTLDRAATLENELRAEQAVAAQLREERQLLVADLGRLRLGAGPTGTSATTSAAEAPPSEDTTPRSVSLLVVAIVAFATAGVGLMVGFAVTPGATAKPRAPDLASAQPRPVVAPPLDIAVPAPSASATIPPEVATCQPGLLHVPRASLNLGQPFPRPTWPRPRSSVVSIEVPAFCIQLRPVSAGDFDQCIKKGQCAVPAKRGCNLGSAPRLPMNCVEHGEAEQYCQAAGMSLPSLAEWERAERLLSRVEVAPGTAEWIEDPFPSSLLDRGAPAACHGGPCSFMWFEGRLPGASGVEPRLSWNRGGSSRENLGFRCVRR